MSCPQIADTGLREAEIRRAEHIVLQVDIWAGAMESFDGGDRACLFKSYELMTVVAQGWARHRKTQDAFSRTRLPQSQIPRLQRGLARKKVN